MQASVTTVFRSASPASSMPDLLGQPGEGVADDGDVLGSAGRDIWSPLGCSLMVEVSAMTAIPAGEPVPGGARAYLPGSSQALRYPRRRQTTRRKPRSQPAVASTP